MAKKWYSLILKNLTLNPTDAQTTYFWQTSNGASNQCRVLIPISWTIKSIICSFIQTATLWSSENSSIYLNKNGASNETLISSAVVNDAKNTNYTLNGVQIPVVVWDYINIQRTTPTRATNPTGVNFNAFIRIE